MLRGAYGVAWSSPRPRGPVDVGDAGYLEFNRAGDVQQGSTRHSGTMPVDVLVETTIACTQRGTGVEHEGHVLGGLGVEGGHVALVHKRGRPVSAGLAVPVFAFFAAGVTIGGTSGLVEALSDRVALGIVAGLVIGKFVGVLGTTYLVARFTRASLDEHLNWLDVAGIALLGGIGFTVSLLIGELAYGPQSIRDEHVKIGVLTGSVIAAVLAASVLRSRNRAYRRICAAEAADADADGIPDVYETRE